MNLVTVARLERNPTIKEEIRLRGFERNIPAGFLAYPVSQAADILAFRADLVPVGSDQLPMIEQTNELARKFNASVGKDVLQECKALLSEITCLPGIDGSAKMSKSMGNAIALRSTDDEIALAVRQMYTDSKHLKVSDPGQVEGNVVFMFLDAFDTNKDELEELKAHYRRGGLGDILLKRRLTDLLQAIIMPIRTKREHYTEDKTAVMDILRSGTDKARERAAQTLSLVKHAMGLNYF
jgi:tryptophanyl-tRNA synthetase